MSHGKYTKYYPNGRTAEKGQYTNNRKTGTWQSWYDNGKKRSVTKYNNGRVVNEKRWTREGKRTGYCPDF